jgi:hypothetical protein
MVMLIAEGESLLSGNVCSASENRSDAGCGEKTGEHNRSIQSAPDENDFGLICCDENGHLSMPRSHWDHPTQPISLLREANGIEKKKVHSFDSHLPQQRSCRVPQPGKKTLQQQARQSNPAKSAPRPFLVDEMAGHTQEPILNSHAMYEQPSIAVPG